MVISQAEGQEELHCQLRHNHLHKFLVFLLWGKHFSQRSRLLKRWGDRVPACLGCSRNASGTLEPEQTTHQRQQSSGRKTRELRVRGRIPTGLTPFQFRSEIRGRTATARLPWWRSFPVWHGASWGTPSWGSWWASQHPGCTGWTWPAAGLTWSSRAGSGYAARWCPRRCRRT